METTLTNAVGWLSALVLLATLVAQIAAQWRDKSGKGVSPWLFAGQLSASLGFVVYSTLTNNVVFVVTNSLMATVALFGQYTYYRNRRGTKQ